MLLISFENWIHVSTAWRKKITIEVEIIQILTSSSSNTLMIVKKDLADTVPYDPYIRCSIGWRIGYVIC